MTRTSRLWGARPISTVWHAGILVHAGVRDAREYAQSLARSITPAEAAK
jgi:hypothetical protein